MGGLLERFVNKSVDAFENLTHRVVVAQLDVFREAHRQINLNLVNKVLDALHDQACSLVEFFKTLLRLLQFDIISVHLVHLGHRQSILLLLTLQRSLLVFSSSSRSLLDKLLNFLGVVGDFDAVIVTFFLKALQVLDLQFELFHLRL